MVKILFKKMDFKTGNFTRGGAMGKLMQNKKIAKVLNRPKERNELYAEMKKYQSGGLNAREMKKVLGKFKFDQNDSLNKKETRVIGREFFKSGKYYKWPAETAGEKPEKKTENPVTDNRLGILRSKRESQTQAINIPDRKQDQEINRPSLSITGQAAKNNQNSRSKTEKQKKSVDTEITDANNSKSRNIYVLLDEIRNKNKE